MQDIQTPTADGIVEKDGKPVSLRIVTYSTKAELSMFCEEMASSLKEVGIDLKVEDLRVCNRAGKDRGF